jgi:regulator of replication initiation timing
MEELKAQEELKSLLDALTALQSDAIKFDEGNGAAGKRIRLELANLRQRMQSLRFEIQTKKNQRRQQKKTASV